MNEIIIKYGDFTHTGTMIINVEEFMKMRSITRVKKLLKIIRTSNTPEVENDIKTHIVEYLENVEVLLKDYANKAVNAKTNMKEAEPKLECLIKSRYLYKRNSERYKYLSDQIKGQRETIRYFKNVWKSQEQNFDYAMKNKQFYEKVLNLLNSK